MANVCATQTGCGPNGSVSVLLNKSMTTVTVTVQSSLNPSVINDQVTFSATLTSNVPIPDGSSVEFFDGITDLGPGATTGGVASFTTTFPKAATHSIRASFAGDVYHKAATGTVRQVVNRYPSPPA